MGIKKKTRIPMQPLLLDKTKTPYENALAHSGFSVSRDVDEGTLILKPNTPFVEECIDKGDDDDDWVVFDADVGGYTILISLKNTSRSEQEGFHGTMRESFHTRWTVELPSRSKSSQWHAYESESVRVKVSEGDTISLCVDVKIDRTGECLSVIRGTFTMPPKDKYDYVGSHGVLLMDPQRCMWTCFLDVLEVSYKDGSVSPTIVAAGIHAMMDR